MIEEFKMAFTNRDKQPSVTNTTGYSVPPEIYTGVPQPQQSVPVTPGVEATYQLGGSVLAGNDTTERTLPGTPMNVGTST
jgi:hypothetical protein